MNLAISPELRWLTYVTLFTALMWLPYVLSRLATRGVLPVLTATKAETLDTPSTWAQRAIRAHANAIENLVLFAPAVLVAHAIGLSTPATQAAAALYFFARVLHYVVYVLGVPVLRTLTFAAAWAGQMVILGSIIASV